MTDSIKERIDRAALALFAGQGVDATPVPVIAERAGVAVGTLYRYYPGKDALAGTLFSENYAALAGRLDRAQAAEGGTMPKLAAMIRLICRFFDEEESLARFLLMEQHVRLKRFDDAANPVEVVVGVLARGAEAGEIACGNPVLAAASIMGVVIQAATFRAYGRLTAPLADAADELVAFCSRALAPQVPA